MGQDEAIAARIVAIVRGLAVELRPQSGRAPRVDLDSDLDRDAGLDSLGRAELLLRLDREFKVRLPDRLIGDARSPRDLLEGVLVASPTVVPPAMEAIGGVALPEVVEPAGAATLLDLLAAHIAVHPERPHILLWRSDDVATPITYGDLDRNARAIAHGLMLRGVSRGDRVVLMLPTEAAEVDLAGVDRAPAPGINGDSRVACPLSRCAIRFQPRGTGPAGPAAGIATVGHCGFPTRQKQNHSVLHFMPGRPLLHHGRCKSRKYGRTQCNAFCASF
jgi:acyl carrier protein